MYGFTQEIFDNANIAFAQRKPHPDFLEQLPNYPPRFGVTSDISEVVMELEDFFGQQLPEDAIWLASNIYDPDSYILRWTRGVEAIKEFERWVYRGVAAEVDAGFWPQAWGAKPASGPERVAQLDDFWAIWPKLLPLTGHRALPVSPAQAGNPVFSLMQTDIIYYGFSLVDWFQLDHSDRSSSHAKFHASKPSRHIPGWSDFAESWWRK